MTHSALFDPELPTATAVLVSLNCVAARYALQPSHALAVLGHHLAQTLTAPEYAESALISVIAKRLLQDWQTIVQAHAAGGQSTAIARMGASPITWQ